MFGYIRPYPPEMKVAEYGKYRAVYCGICRDIGRCSGQLSRMGLSYDTVLLCAVRMVLSGIKPEFEPLRCPAHPSKKRAVMKSNDASRFTAAAFALLAAAKNSDDLADEKGIGRLKPVILSPLFRHMKKCGEKELENETWETLVSLLSSLSELERNGCDSLDATSDAFGAVLGYLFSLGYTGETAENAAAVGKSAGKFVYMCDAADDLPDDVRKDRYNPLRCGWGDMALEDGKLSPMVRESLSSATPIALESLGEAAEKLDPSHEMTPVIKNIVYLGLPQSLAEVLSGRKRKRREFTDTEDTR